MKKTIEEHVADLAQTMNTGFSGLNRRMDLYEQEMRSFRQFVGQKFVKIDERFDKMDERFDRMDSKMDGVLKTLRNHDEDIAVLQKAVGHK